MARRTRWSRFEGGLLDVAVAQPLDLYAKFGALDAKA
jgi:hypothetical protein